VIKVLYQNKNIFNYVNLTEYHNQNYTGKGVKVCILESDTDHRNTVAKSLSQSAPDCEIIYVNLSSIENTYQKIIDSKANIVTCSNGKIAGNLITLEQSLDLINRNILLLCAVGNDDSSGVVKLAKDENWISVGAVTLDNYNKPRLAEYSSIGEEIDIVGFIPYVQGGYVYQPIGTSFASPFVAGMCACFYQAFKELYNRLPIYQEIFNLLTTNVEDMLDIGKDIKTGYGLFKLPKVDNIELFIKEVNLLERIIKMDTISKIDSNDRTLIPLRFFAEALGCEVGWNNETKTVTINQNNKIIEHVIGTDIIYIKE